jgi:hypothetical protein
MYFLQKFCCGKQKNKHFIFQCKDNIDPTIASILNAGFVGYGLSQGNQYVVFMGVYEIFSFISEKPDTCDMASSFNKQVLNF